MCISYVSTICSDPNRNRTLSFQDFSAASSEVFGYQAGDHRSLPINDGNGLEILGMEELLKSPSKDSTASSNSDVDSKSTTKEESSFADYDGGTFLVDDDSSTTSKASTEISESSSFDAFTHWLEEPLDDEEEEEEEIEADWDTLFPGSKEHNSHGCIASNGRDDHSTPARRVSFDNNVHFREYAVTVGSHNKSCGVCPLELSWEYIEGKNTMPAEKEECVCNKAMHTFDATHVKIPAKSFHDSFDAKIMNTSSQQHSLNSMLHRTSDLQQKKTHSRIHRLSTKERIERIAAVQGISVKQVKQMELKSVLDQVNDSINIIELLGGQH